MGPVAAILGPWSDRGTHGGVIFSLNPVKENIVEYTMIFRCKPKCL